MSNFNVLGRIFLVFHHVDGLSVLFYLNYFPVLGVVKGYLLLEVDRFDGVNPLQSISNLVFVSG